MQVLTKDKENDGILHNRVAGGFSPPAPTPPGMRVYPKGTSCGRAPGGSRRYRAVAGYMIQEQFFEKLTATAFVHQEHNLP